MCNVWAHSTELQVIAAEWSVEFIKCYLVQEILPFYRKGSLRPKRKTELSSTQIYDSLPSFSMSTPQQVLS